MSSKGALPATGTSAVLAEKPWPGDSVPIEFRQRFDRQLRITAT